MRLTSFAAFWPAATRVVEPGVVVSCTRASCLSEVETTRVRREAGLVLALRGLDALQLEAVAVRAEEYVVLVL